MGQLNVQEVRPAAQAGKYYPAEPDFLAKVVDDLLAKARPPQEDLPPKAIIVPHGGYIYSGEIAANAFAPWLDFQHAVNRVVLIGPSHFYDFPGLALPDTSVFATPLGELTIDAAAVEQISRLSFIRAFEAAHDPEHALEVQLPFIQRLFGAPMIVPLITGRADSSQVAQVLETLWGGPETLLVISSDLSHYHDYGAAQKYDGQTAEWIIRFHVNKIGADQACGYQAIRGLLKCALRREMRCVAADLRNSGDTAGPTNEVTGFGAFYFFEL